MENQFRAAAAAAGLASAAPPDDVRAWADWIAEFALWKSFVTLTIANEHICSKETAQKRLRLLIQILNKDLYGNHYLRKVGHCYFSYVVGYEFTKAGVVHLHMLVDRPINFSLVHRVWNKISGYAYIRPVYQRSGVARYICKYVVKRQDLDLWKPKKNVDLPPFVPLWFNE